jgi:hypothetical protein
MNIGLVVGDEYLPRGLFLASPDLGFFGKEEIIGLIA